MRHHKKTRTLGRSKNQRVALMKSLTRNLIEEGTIVTTEAKAKSLRPMVERLLTKAKVGDLASIRHIASTIGSPSSASKLVKEIAPKFADRKGGYTRIIKLPNRLSDNSPMAVIAFVA
jgi:large subunit ribosomal protein L17